MRKRRSGYARFWLSALALAFIGACVLFIVTHPAVEAETTQAPDPAGYSLIYSADNPIPGIAERVRPAVVQVIAKQQQWDRVSRSVAEVEIGYGSGTYIDERGYILTNYHVIEGADQVEIQLLGGARLPVDQFFFDSDTDLALLKFSGDIGASVVPMGNSDAVQIGELAIAIGNPGISDSVFTGTVTAGIISGLDREDISAGNFSRAVNVIQIDAPINSGNSGGALLNRGGELIGVPTLKINSAYGVNYEGLGFAIPINAAKGIISDLIEYGMVRRPKMGVSISSYSGPDQAIKSHPPAGVWVDAVEPGSPAEQAGVLRYDIITEIDGVRVKSYTALTKELDKKSEGDRVKLTIYRYYDSQTGLMLDSAQQLDAEVTLKILD
ncbi:MAG: PDZ domain-containing protein [Clostridiales bacterium]|nr:PDZ domain-containing protein [Clostridiales bacterium]